MWYAGRDIREAYRSLRRSPGFTSMAALCLALGIGANTAAFTVTYSVLFRPLPFDQPDRLAMVWATFDEPGGEDNQYWLTPPYYLEIVENSSTLSVAASRVEAFRLGRAETLRQVSGAKASAELFPLLGLRPVVGRVFDETEDKAGSNVAVIGTTLWQQEFGRTPNIVGSSIVINGQSHTVVGVLPSGGQYPDDVDLWVPLAARDIHGPELQRGSLAVVGRLRDGATLLDAQTELTTLATEYSRVHGGRSTGLGFGAEGLQENLVGDLRQPLLVLWGGVSVLLMIAVVNVANLMLVRARSEAHLFALRTSLGASPPQLLRQVLAEYGGMAMLGGVAGLALAYAVLPPLLSLQPDRLVPFGAVSINATVLWFTVAVSMGTSILLAIVIWLRQKRVDPIQTLRETNTKSGLGIRGRRVLSLLAVLEIAASMVLLVAAGLMLRSFDRLRSSSPGFEVDDALVVRIAASVNAGETHTGRVAFFEQVDETIRALPGVTAAGATHSLPISGVIFAMGFNVQGKPPDEPGKREFAVMRLVTPEYFQALRVPLIGGRTFDATDRQETEPVAIVSQELARRHWPGEDPLGQRLKRGTYEQADEPWRTVVGVVADVRDQGLDGDIQPALFFPHSQLDRTYASVMTFVIRAGSEPTRVMSAIRQRVKDVDPNALILESNLLEDVVAETAAADRFNTILMSIFAGLGLVLAVAGIYGVISYSVAERRAEWGLRMALGSGRGAILRAVLAEAFQISALGITFGIALSWFTTKLMSGVLFDVGSTDPATYFQVSLLLVLTATTAAIIPAWRATRVDPRDALTG